MIKQFSGAGDVVAWLKKDEQLAKLQNVPDFAAAIPVFWGSLGQCQLWALKFTHLDCQDSDWTKAFKKCL